MLDSVLHAIAEPNRRQILQLLHWKELSAGEISAQFSVSRPAISQHLKVLEEAGLVLVRAEGTRRLYRFRPDGLSELKSFLEQFWDEQLFMLKEVAEAEEKQKGVIKVES
ncbi:MAG: winged helix-turn-helix transcriptional regulator [Chloroflexi bacterium]|uniref:Metalloregulator ArsR/SmtB family transcription factor n=1 Tax=Candidatus Chlorohelix allophototropha TaxID=3003348 RepID=A0A8T7MAJ5_9CHLR|nr:winged helix-turn-helix transcriptional regulator [Chloroflexota bacterium]WJW68863.1 metalloregulator ArsR/SmtB family transcription factor [Chloroflexota bacterium L227-S17]